MIILKSNLDGKIILLKTKSHDLNHFLNKRVFNLIDKYEVLYFIQFFYDFVNDNLLKKKKISVNINFFDNKIYSKITLVKKNKYIYISFKKDDINSIIIKKTNIFNTFLFITRFKFVIGSILPFVFSICWSFYNYENISYINIFFVLIGLILLHIIANTFNDYFDWVSERDSKNLDYIFNSSGGSRAIDLKLITHKSMLNISYFLTFLLILIGSYFIVTISFKILLIGLFGFFSLYFYSAPPIHLASRYGAGELAHIICLGPLITYGSVLALCSNTHTIDFFIGLPFGLIITCCLIVNEYPDSNSDKNAGKNNLAVILGAKNIFPVIALLYGLVFVLNFLIFCKLNNIYYFMVLLVPYFFSTLKAIKNIEKNSKTACEKSINIYILYSLLLIILTLIINFI